MSLKDSIRFSRVPAEPLMPPVPLVAAQTEILKTKFDAARSLSPLDAEALKDRLRNAAEQSDWSAITFRDWKKAAWILFGEPQPLAEARGFFDKLLGEYREKKKRTAYQGLILAYLRDYDPKTPSIRRAGQEIRKVLEQYDWPWKQRGKDYDLFSEYAHETLGNACLASNSPPAVLSDAGMGGARAYGGLATYAYGHAVGQLREHLSKPKPDFSRLDTVLAWSVNQNGLTYPKLRAALATALLSPWSNRTPPEAQKATISDFLLSRFHDPRLPANAKDWIGVDEDAVAVLRKWLTGEALEQFFSVVDQVAKESMWRYRRAFWLSYYESDRISDAWVLFGREAQRYARRAFGNAQSYGLLDGGQIQPNHSVLLMKIGKLTIADWSHDGKCHIWRDGNEYAPKLYHGRYARAEVTQESNNDGQAHHGSEGGTWQRKVADYIRKNTGVSVSEHNYMPRGRGY